MIDSGAQAVLVLLFGHLQVGLDGGIVHGTVFEAAVVEGTGNADSAERIQAVGILDNGQFRREKFLPMVTSFKGNVLNDIYNVPGYGVRGFHTLQKAARLFRADAFVSVMKLGVSNIM